MGTIDKSGAYFRKTVGAVKKNTPEEEEMAVALIARNARDTDDLQLLLEAVALTSVAERLQAKRSA